MHWKEYEDQVLQYFQERFPQALIKKNAQLPGRLSKTNRDIDILIESQIFGHSIQIAIECKNWSSKLDVADVGVFIDRLKDVGISKGVIVSKLGYTNSAHQRARSEIELQLQVLDFENMPEFYGFYGFPYRGDLGAIVSAPNGWVVNSNISNELLIDMLCYIHPFEYSHVEAQKKKQFMYFQIYPIVDDYDLEKTLLWQGSTIQQKDNTCDIEYWKEDTLNGSVAYRKIQSTVKEYTEFTAGVESEDFFAYCVYTVPLHSIPDDIARLRYVMDNLRLIKMINVDPTDSHRNWHSLFAPMMK
jgi:hypothetical protein